MPTMDAWCAPELHYAKVFSTMACRSAFQRLRFNRPSSELCAFEMPFGTYKFAVWTFFLSQNLSGPHTCGALLGLRGVQCIGDDSKTVAEATHDNRNSIALHQCQAKGIKFNRNNYATIIYRSKTDLMHGPQADSRRDTAGGTKAGGNCISTLVITEFCCISYG
jgi:hypothetical protein